MYCNINEININFNQINKKLKINKLFIKFIKILLYKLIYL